MDVISSVFSLFGLLYLLFLPLVIIGFFKNVILEGWTILLLFCSFDILFVPFSALVSWQRWMFMLIYPFTFYAVNGVSKVTELNGSYGAFVRKILKNFATGVIMCVVLLGLLFMSIRFENGGLFYTPYTIAYFPSTMLHNTILLQDVNGVIKAFMWLNEHMDDHSVVLVQHALLSWATSHLGEKNMIIYYVRDVDEALNLALEHNYYKIYTVWWLKGKTWKEEQIVNYLFPFMDVSERHELPEGYTVLKEGRGFAVYLYERKS